MSFIQELKERKIPPTLVFYLGGGWVLIEALNFFIEKYGWTARIFDLLIILLVFGLPATLLYSWFHGKSETSKIQKKELIFHVVNLVIAISVVTYFIIKPSEAPAREARNEPSETKETFSIAVLPLHNPSKSIAILPFKNLSQDNENEVFIAGVMSDINSLLIEDERN